MRIAIYGGSFNPMHIGHEKIVDYVLNNLNMDKIIIIPVGIPSHRENNLEQSDTRLKICKEIFKENKKIEVSDIEIKSEGKSYTYDTLLKLMDLYGENNEFFEIIGEDSLKSLKTWKNYEELLKICKFIVFRRKDDKNIQIDEEFLNNKNIGGTMFNIADNRIYMNDEKGNVIAEVTFPNLDANTIVIDHTFVDDSLRGQGIAAKLMLEVIDYAKSNNKKIKATCSYAVKWFDKNRDEYKDLYIG